MARTSRNDLTSRLRKQALQLLTVSISKLMTQKHINKAFRQPGGAVLFFDLCIKSGRLVTLAEAEAMRFVAKHTSVPVPKVYHAFTRHGRTYILMERIHGEMIAKRWHAISDTSKVSIFDQLRRLIEELRSVPPDTTAVSNLEGGPIYDERLPDTSFWGPFDSIHDFHLALRNNIPVQAFDVQAPTKLSPTDTANLRKLCTFQESVTGPPVLTHGDLSSLNILLRNDKIVGIIDWETAGWMPYYWEYTTAWHANPQNFFWQKEVDNFLTPYTSELEMDNLRRRYFGEI